MSTQDTELNFELHDKQGEAFTSEATEILYGGAKGGGKSHLLRVAAILWCTQIPNLNVYFFRKTNAALKSNHMEGANGFRNLLYSWTNEKKVEIVEDEIRFLFNGARIFFRALGDDDALDKYQGSEMHVLMVDEASQFTDSQYRYLRGQVRMPKAMQERLPDHLKGNFPRILLSANPGGIGHQWLKKGFVDEGKESQVRKMPDSEGGFKRQYIPAILTDNPSLDAAYWASLDGLYSPELVQALKYGDWDIIAGAYFPEFQPSKHVIPRFKIPSHWNRVVAGDWGYSTPFAFVWLAMASEDYEIPGGITIPKDALVCYREYYGVQVQRDGKIVENKGLNMTPEEVAAAIRDIEEAAEDTNIVSRVLDESAFNKDSGPSKAEMMTRKGLYFHKSSRRRIPGWLQMRQRLRGDGKTPMLYFIGSHCPHIIRTFPMMQHDEKNIEDMMTSGEDHLMDALRYACMDRPWAAPTPVPKEPIFRNPTVGELAAMTFKQHRNRNPDRI